MFFLFKKTSDSLIPSFLMSDMSKSLRLLTKNERISESLSFLSKKRAIHSENRWANFQPCLKVYIQKKLYRSMPRVAFLKTQLLYFLDILT